MRINAINYAQQNYAGRNLRKVNNRLNEQKTNTNLQEQVSFKGAKGGVLGIFAGAATGAALAAATIATGGLAGVVAAVGTSSTIIGGAAAGTHIGGIIGALISGKDEGD